MSNHIWIRFFLLLFPERRDFIGRAFTNCTLARIAHSLYSPKWALIMQTCLISAEERCFLYEKRAYLGITLSITLKFSRTGWIFLFNPLSSSIGEHIPNSDPLTSALIYWSKGVCVSYWDVITFGTRKGKNDSANIATNIQAAMAISLYFSILNN